MPISAANDNPWQLHEVSRTDATDLHLSDLVKAGKRLGHIFYGEEAKPVIESLIKRANLTEGLSDEHLAAIQGIQTDGFPAHVVFVVGARAVSGVRDEPIEQLVDATGHATDFARARANVFGGKIVERLLYSNIEHMAYVEALKDAFGFAGVHQLAGNQGEQQ